MEEGKRIRPPHYFDMLRILADENRLTILSLLAEHRELCASDILSFLRISQPTLSHHMNVLLENHLITARKTGRWVFYRVNAESITELIGFFSSMIQEEKAQSNSRPLRGTFHTPSTVSSPSTDSRSRSQSDLSPAKTTKISAMAENTVVTPDKTTEVAVQTPSLDPVSSFSDKIEKKEKKKDKKSKSKTKKETKKKKKR